MQDTLDNLYEELIYLDEVAGELDEEGNRRTNERRKELIKEINITRSLGSRWG
jgi:hypothetical protein